MNHLDKARGEVDRTASSEPNSHVQPLDSGPTRVSQWLDALRKYEGRHVVVIRGYPDPDSLASAWAHARLAASIGIQCDIAHLPLVSRAENRAMVSLLGMCWRRFHDMGSPPARCGSCVEHWKQCTWKVYGYSQACIRCAHKIETRYVKLPIPRIECPSYLYRGLGVGLYLAHHLAKLCRGFLTVDSVEGEGTVCRLHVPVET